MSTVVWVVAGTFAVRALVRAARRVEVSQRAAGFRVRRPRLLPPLVRLPLTRALARADLEVDPEQAVRYAGLAAFAVVVISGSVAPGLIVPTAAGALVAGPIGLHAARHRRSRRFDSELPALLDRVAAQLRGGGTVAQALVAVGNGPGPVAADVGRVVRRCALGVSLPESLAVWARERGHADVTAIAGGCALATSLGGRAAVAIDGLASSLRQRRDAHAEIRALSAQGRLSALVVGGAPLGFVVLSAMVDPGSVSTLVSGPVGRACLVAGLTFEALGAWWIRRIVRAEPVG